MTEFLLFVNPIYANTNAFAKFLIFHGFHPWCWKLCKDDCSKARVLGALYTPRARHAAGHPRFPTSRTRLKMCAWTISVLLFVVFYFWGSIQHFCIGSFCVCSTSSCVCWCICVCRAEINQPQVLFSGTLSVVGFFFGPLAHKWHGDLLLILKVRPIA